MNEEKNYMGSGPGYDNFTVNDSVTENGVTELSVDKSEKPYDNAGIGANYDKFVVDNSSDTGEGRTEEPARDDPAKGGQFGQMKYAKRGSENTIYHDPTRDTENDEEARKIECEPGVLDGSEEEGDGAGEAGID